MSAARRIIAALATVGVVLVPTAAAADDPVAPDIWVDLPAWINTTDWQMGLWDYTEHPTLDVEVSVDGGAPQSWQWSAATADDDRFPMYLSAGPHRVHLVATAPDGGSTSQDALVIVDLEAPVAAPLFTPQFHIWSDAGGDYTYGPSLKFTLPQAIPTSDFAVAIVDGDEENGWYPTGRTLEVTADPGQHRIDLYHVDQAGNRSPATTYNLEVRAGVSLTPADARRDTTSTTADFTVSLPAGITAPEYRLNATTDYGAERVTDWLPVSGADIHLERLTSTNQMRTYALEVRGYTDGHPTPAVRHEWSAHTQTPEPNRYLAARYANGSYSSYGVRTILGSPDVLTVSVGDWTPSSEWMPTYSIDGAPMAPMVADGYELTIPVPAPGDHDLTISATDQWGNTATRSRQFTVDPAHVVAIEPLMPFSPAAEQSSWTFNVTTDASQVPDPSFEYRVDGGPWQSDYVWANGFSVGYRAPGSHTIEVAVRDIDDVQHTASYTWQVDPAGFGTAFTVEGLPATTPYAPGHSFHLDVTSGDLAEVRASVNQWTLGDWDGTGNVALDPLYDGDTNVTVFARNSSGVWSQASASVYTMSALPQMYPWPSNDSGSRTTHDHYTIDSWGGAVGMMAPARLEWQLDDGPTTVYPTAFDIYQARDISIPLTVGEHLLKWTVTDTHGRVVHGERELARVSDPIRITAYNSSPVIQARDAVFEVSSDWNAATVTGWRFDGGPWEPWAWRTIDGIDLPAGTHTLEVRGEDAYGRDPLLATHTFTIDAAASDGIGPDVTVTGPNGWTGTSVATLSATVASGDTSGGVTVSVDGATAQPWDITSPFTSAPLTDGPHTLTVVATDSEGDTTTRTLTFTVDTANPGVSIVTGPSDGTSTSATFTWTTTDASPVTTTYSLDGGGWVSAANGVTVTVTPGAHSLTVVGVDAAGNVGSATYGWLVSAAPPADTIAPTLAWVSKPASTTSTGSATFTWSTDDPSADTWVKLDSSPAVGLGTDTAWTTVVAEGTHTVTVWSADAAGNVSNLLTRTWTADLTAPSFTVTAPALTRDPSPDLTLVIGETPASVTVSVDGAAPLTWADPSTPFTLPALPDNVYDVAVTVTDGAGHATTEHVTVRIDSTSATASWVSAPTSAAAGSGVTFTWSTSEPTRHWVSIDGAAPVYVATATTYTAPALPAGPHTIEVTGADDADNYFVGLTHTWTVTAAPTDTTPPHLAWVTTPGDGPSRTATFTWSNDDATAVQWIAIDGGPAAAVTGTSWSTTVSVGAHTVELGSSDLAGNDATALTHTWTVSAPPAPADTTPPSLHWSRTPEDGTTSRLATFEWSSDDADAATWFSLDGAQPERVYATAWSGEVGIGQHTAVVTSRDAAGNFATALMHQWSVAALQDPEPQHPTPTGKPTRAPESSPQPASEPTPQTSPDTVPTAGPTPNTTAPTSVGKPVGKPSTHGPAGAQQPNGASGSPEPVEPPRKPATPVRTYVKAAAATAGVAAAGGLTWWVFIPMFKRRTKDNDED